MRAAVLGVLLVFAGVLIGGFLASFFWSAESQGTSQSSNIDAPVLVQPLKEKERRKDEQKQMTQRLAGLERQVAELSKASSSASPSAASNQVNDEAPPMKSPEESKQRAIARIAVLDEQFAAEARDEAWSRASEAAFSKDLRQLGEFRNFSVSGVECRTTLCRAQIAWPSYGDTVGSWRSVIEQSWSKNCRTEVQVPAPDDPEAEYQAMAWFDCTDLRADEISGEN